MYRINATDTPEVEEPLRLPTDSLSSWLVIVFFTAVTVALGVGLGLTRWQLEQVLAASSGQAAPSQPPARPRPGQR